MPMRSTGDGPPKFDKDESLGVDFPAYGLFEATLTGPAKAFNLKGFERGALERIPQSTRDEEGAEVKAKVLGVGKLADSNGLNTHGGNRLLCLIAAG